MSNSYKNRVGRFRIGMVVVKNRPAEIVQMFYDLKILVVRAEARFDCDAIEYVGISPEFEEVEPSTYAPDYFITAEENPDTPGKYLYKIKKGQA